MVQVHSSAHHELLFDSASRVLLFRFLGDVPDEAYISCWQYCMKFACTEKVNRFVLDQQQQGRISASAREWVLKNAFPYIQMNMSDDSAVAILPALHVYDQGVIKYLMGSFYRMTRFNMEIFSSEAQALAWLKQANELPVSSISTVEAVSPA
jgi:hypothetical protein